METGGGGVHGRNVRRNVSGDDVGGLRSVNILLGLLFHGGLIVHVENVLGEYPEGYVRVRVRIPIQDYMSLPVAVMI